VNPSRVLSRRQRPTGGTFRNRVRHLHSPRIGSRLLGVSLAVLATLLAVFAGRFGRRASVRGVTSAVGAAVAASLFGPGHRPSQAPRQGWRRSMAPSTPVAATVGFCVGAGLELPPPEAVPVAGALVLLVAWSQLGVESSLGIAIGACVGLMTAAGTKKVWPVAPRTGATVRSVPVPAHCEPAPAGGGLVVVVNAHAGSSSAETVDSVRHQLPEANIVELEEDADLVAALEEGAVCARAIGIAGGDGSINAAAEVALRHGLPLMVVPAGTLNHFARDVGLRSTDDAIRAVQNGDVAAVDVGSIAGKPFLNTASFGGYAELVDARERLEDRLGKWPALTVALVRILRRSEPVEVELDGQPRLIWMIFIGNCGYHPSGFAPTWRERLDDGQLDIRLVHAGQPWSRTRLVLAVMTGRLGRCRVYEQRTARQLSVRSVAPMRLARDGETFDGPTEFVIAKHDKPLLVFTPPQTKT
jgi:diacylglycerol kinase family enzyme